MSTGARQPLHCKRGGQAGHNTASCLVRAVCGVAVAAVASAHRAAPQPRRCSVSSQRTTRRTKAAPHRCSVCRQAWLNASRGPTRPADAAAQVSPLPRRCSVCARGNQRCRESRTVDDAGQQEVGAGANATLGSSVPAQALTLATMTGSSTMRSGSAPKRSASGPAPVDSVRQPHGPSGSGSPCRRPPRARPSR